MPIKKSPITEARANGTFDFRTPFQLAISDDSLLGGAWKQLSLPQQVALKAFYGLPLLNEEEMRLWAAFQGFGVYDDLGYLQDVTYIPPYEAKEYEVLTGLIGRRSGKSDRIGGLAAAYEICLGGHSAYIKPGQPTFWLYIAQDLDTAKLNLKFVTSWIKESPVLSKMIVHETEEQIEFANGVILKAEPPNIRTGRGAAVIGITMDEMAFWYKNAKSANPDFEVIRALEYAQSQFPHAKQLRITTPWTKEGVAYLGWKRGTEGMRVGCSNCTAAPHLCIHAGEDREEDEGNLVLYSPTAAMQNPRMTRRKLLRLWKRDKEAFKRESLAQFIDSQTSFLTFASVESAVDERQGTILPDGAIIREPRPGVDYVASIDPAFRHDSFAFTVGHHEKTRGIVQDYVKEWIPEPGERLDPKVVLGEIKPILDRFGLDLLYSDQGQYEALASLAEDFDITLLGIDLTKKSKPKMMNNMQSIFNQKRIRLLPLGRQEEQLKKLVKTVGPSGYVNVSAPPPHHDDLAMNLALMLSVAISLPAFEEPSESGRGTKISYISPEELQKIWRKRLENMEPEEIDEQIRRRALLEAYE